MRALSQPVRRLLAVSILIFLCTGLWLYVAAPLVGAVTDRRAEIAELNEMRDRLIAIRARRPVLEATEQGLRGRIAADVSLWSGISTTAIAAGMQNLIRQAATGAGGQMKSTAEPVQGGESGLRTVSVRFQIEGSTGALVATLEAIERARPRLFIERIAISAPVAQVGSDREPMLTIDIVVLGFAAERPS